MFVAGSAAGRGGPGPPAGSIPLGGLHPVGGRAKGFEGTRALFSNATCSGLTAPRHVSERAGGCLPSNATGVSRGQFVLPF